MDDYYLSVRRVNFFDVIVFNVEMFHIFEKVTFVTGDNVLHWKPIYLLQPFS